MIARHRSDEVSWDGRNVALRGATLAYLRRLDRALADWACARGAEEVEAGPTISAATLARAGYLAAFPRHATFPACLRDEARTLAAFAADGVAGDGSLRLERLAPCADVLTPAACYHVYPAFADAHLDRARHVTLLGRCWRREKRFEPLRRQHAFRMREWVVVGHEEEVSAALDAGREALLALAARLGLSLSLVPATDPFFRGDSPAALLQRLGALKVEACAPDGLALGSINRHLRHFGAAFGVRRADEVAASGCVAFGLERWISALVDRHGPEAARWPAPEGFDG